MTKVLKVTVGASGKKTAPFRYTAHLADGTTAVIRTATRDYANAFQYDYKVCSGPSGLSAHFTFGVKPGSYSRAPIATFPIEREGDEAPRPDRTHTFSIPADRCRLVAHHLDKAAKALDTIRAAGPEVGESIKAAARDQANYLRGLAVAIELGAV